MFEEPAHTRGEVLKIICNVNYGLEEKKATCECWRSLCRKVPVQTHCYRGVGTADFSAKASTTVQIQLNCYSNSQVSTVRDMSK